MHKVYNFRPLRICVFLFFTQLGCFSFQQATPKRATKKQNQQSQLILIHHPSRVPLTAPNPFVQLLPHPRTHTQPHHLIGSTIPLNTDLYTLVMDLGRKDPNHRFKAAASGVNSLMNAMKKTVVASDKTIIKSFQDILFQPHDFVQKKEELTSVCKAFFDTVDADNSGEISVVEFMTALRVIGERLGPKFQHPSAMSLFAKLDIDQGGSIDIDELVQGVAANYECQFVEICYAVRLSQIIRQSGADAPDAMKLLHKKRNDTEQEKAYIKVTQDQKGYITLLLKNQKEHIATIEQLDKVLDKKVEDFRLLSMENTELRDKLLSPTRQDEHEQIITLQQELEKRTKTAANNNRLYQDRIKKLEEQLQVRTKMISEKDQDLLKVQTQNERNRNDAARERKLRRSSLSTVNHNEQHLLELTQQLAVMTAREKQASKEAADYKSRTQELEEVIDRLGGALEKGKDDLEIEKEEHQDHKATLIRILERKIGNLQKQLVQANKQLTENNIDVNYDEKRKEDVEKDNLLIQLKDQNSKLLRKVDRLRTDNANVSIQENSRTDATVPLGCF